MNRTALLTALLLLSGCSQLMKRHTDTKTITKSVPGSARLDFEAALEGTKLKVKTRRIQALTEEVIKRETTGWKRGQWPIWEVVIPDLDILISIGISIYAAFSDEYEVRYSIGGVLLSIVPGITCQCYGYERAFEEVEGVVETPVSSRETERRTPVAARLLISGAGQRADIDTGAEGAIDASLARYACAALVRGQRSLSLQVALAEDPASTRTLYLGTRDLIAIADEAVAIGLTPGFKSPGPDLRRAFWTAVAEASATKTPSLAEQARRLALKPRSSGPRSSKPRSGGRPPG